MNKLSDADGVIVYGKNMRSLFMLVVLLPVGGAMSYYLGGPWFAYPFLALFSLCGLLLGGYSERLEVDSIRGQVIYSRTLLAKSLQHELFPFSRVFCVSLYPDTQPQPSGPYQLSLEWQSEAGRGLALLSTFYDEAQAKVDANRLAAVLSTQVSRDPGAPLVQSGSTHGG